MRTPHRLPRSLRLAIALGLALAAAGPAAAPTARAQSLPCVFFDDLSIHRGETLDCDANIVWGDLVVEPGALVTGSVNVLNGDAEIAGRVAGDAYAGGDLQVDGEIGGQASAQGRLEVLATGKVGGGVRSLGEDVAVAGAVGGDAEALGNVEVASTALVRGAVVAAGERVVAPGAEVLGLSASGTRATAPVVVDPRLPAFLGVSLALVAALLAAVLAAAAPDALGRVGHALRRGFVPSLLAGTAALLAMLVLWIFVIPVFAYLLAAVLGTVALGDRLGAKLLAGRWRPAGAALGTGLLLLVAGGALALTSAWWMLCLVGLLLLGLHAWTVGAALLTVFGTRSWPRVVPEGDAAPIPPAIPAEATPGAPIPEASPLPPGALPVPAGGNPEAGPVAAFALPASMAVLAPPEDLPGVALEAGPASAPPTPEGLAAGVAAGAAASGSPATPGGPVGSGLRRVPGITPIYAHLLQEAGVGTVEALTALSPERVLEIVTAPGVMPISLDAASQWIRDARALAPGADPAL